MDFTELYKHSGASGSYAPAVATEDGGVGRSAFLASAAQHRLVIRSARTLAIRFVLTCAGPIHSIHWFPSSNPRCPSYRSHQAPFELRIMAVGGNGKWIHVFGGFPLEDSDSDADASGIWEARIETGFGGAAKVAWTPDGNHVLVFSDYKLRATIWSLLDPAKQTKYVRFPKSAERAWCFRPDGRYWCYAERLEGKDHLSIVDTKSWTLIKQFPVPTTDVADIAWSPDGNHLLLWDDPIYWKVVVCTPDGRILSSYTPSPAANDIDVFPALVQDESIGQEEKVYAQQGGLGIRTCAWHPSGQLAVVGCYDQTVYRHKKIPILTLKLSNVITEHDIQVVFKESASAISEAGIRTSVKYELFETPYTLPTPRLDPDKPSLKFGISHLSFDATGSFLAIRSDSFPSVVYIFDMTHVHFAAILIHASPIRNLSWHPTMKGVLAMWCTESANVYIWRESGAECVLVPAVGFEVVSVAWSGDGESMCVMDKEKFCIGFSVHE